MATQPQDQEQPAANSAFPSMDLIKNESSVMEVEDDESLDLLEATEPPLLEDDVASAGLDFKHEVPGFNAAADDKCTSVEQTVHEQTLLKEEPLGCLEEKREALGSPDQEYEPEQQQDSVPIHLQQQHAQCDQQKEQELRMPSPLQPTTDARPQDQLSVPSSVSSSSDATTSKADASPEATAKLPALSGNKRPPPTPVTSQSFSWNDILRVQNLIERCLHQYLSKHEILMALKEQANVEPDFTTVVWQKLEQQNPSFFRAYNLQLQLKEQILAFNFLVKQQREMMGGTTPANKFLSSTTSRAPQGAWSMSASGPSDAARSSFLRAPNSNSHKMPRTGARQQPPQQRPTDANAFQSSFGSPSALPLPSPIKSDLDTHAFFT